MKRILTACCIGVFALLSSCTKEDSIQASGDLGFEQRFSPKENELPQVKEMFKTYDLWLRLGFEDAKEVTNAILAQDVNNRFGATPIDENMKSSAIMFVDTLLKNVSKEYVQKVFPKEFFFVKTYNGSWWKENVTTIGRGRMIVCWPNEANGVQPITVPETHYYQDSVVTRMVWSTLAGLLSRRMEKVIPGFEAAGTPYDNGKAFDEIMAKYPVLAERRIKLAELAQERGHISAPGSRSYQVDLSQWIGLLTTESYENIKKVYLDNSPKRLAKYKVFTEYLKKEYNWDIQASGNKYRQKLGSFQ